MAWYDDGTEFIDPPQDPYDLSRFPRADGGLPIPVDVLNILGGDQGISTKPQAQGIAALLDDGLIGALSHGITGAITGITELAAAIASRADLLVVEEQATEAFAAANTAQNAVTDLSAIVAASKVTQAWVGNATDMPSVPRVNLKPELVSLSSDSHFHAKGSLSASTSTGNITGSTAADSHTHTMTLRLPAYSPSVTKITPAHGTIYFTPIISDRQGELDMFRFITGADDSLFGIDGYYVALMIYNIPEGKLQTIWNPGNIMNSMGSARSEVSIDMGLTGSAALVQPEQILFAAHQQIAPGLAQSPRSVVWVPQGGIGRTNDVLLKGAFYRTSDDVPAGIPAEVNMSSLVPINTGLPWYAVSVNS